MNPREEAVVCGAADSEGVPRSGSTPPIGKNRASAVKLTTFVDGTAYPRDVNRGRHIADRLGESVTEGEAA